MTSIKISALTEAEIPDFLKQCAQERGEAEWARLADLAQQMLRGERGFWLAYDADNILSGMVTLRWHSDYAGFRHAPRAPEMIDLYVWRAKRRQGFARALLKHVEQEAITRGFTRIGLGVGILADDMPAWRLYMAQDYEFDGSGAWWTGRPVADCTMLQPQEAPVLLMMHKKLIPLQAKAHV